MSLWQRIFGRSKPPDPAPVLRDIPESALKSSQVLNCDPHATDPERRFSIGKWGLQVADDPDSQRIARGVLKKSAGKTLRLEPGPRGRHKGVISSMKSGADGGGYRWLNVEVDLRAGTVCFSEGSTATDV